MDKKPAECKAGAPEWMATYGDLVTLLMCFFVLLFAFSTIDAQKFTAVMQSFSGSAGILESGTSLEEAELVFKAMPENDTTQQSQEMQELQDIKEKVVEFLEEQEIDVEISLELQEQGLVIRFVDNALFDPGKAVIKDSVREVLDFLGQLLMSEQFSTREIRVEGHTDNVPNNSPKYPSNWELSTARATNVIRYFLEKSKIEPIRMSVAAYSEYKPIDTNETKEGRAKNRRVDVVILRDLYADNIENEETTNEAVPSETATN